MGTHFTFGGGTWGARTSALVTALVTLLLVLACTASSARAADARDVFGVATHVAYKDYASAYGGDIDRELDALGSAGARWIRLSMSWGWSESKKGQYNEDYFSQVESVLRKAQARGLKVLFVTDGSPYWANPGGKGYPPQDPRDYAVWLTHVVDRFEAYSPAWEVWNEPNLGRFWGGAPNAAEYVELLKVSYAAIKAADPDAIVVSAGLAQGGGSLEPTQFLRDMYAAGAQGFFDKLGFHPYSGQYSPDTWWPDHPYGTFMVTEKGIRPIMVANGDADKQIWLTEMGYSTYRQADGSVGRYGVDEATQAEYLARAYEKVRQEWPFVDVMFWYNARDDGTDITSFGQNTGMMTFDYRMKPSYAAYQRVSGGAPASTTTTTAARTSTTAPVSTTTTTSTTVPVTITSTTTTVAVTTTVSTVVAPATPSTTVSTTPTVGGDDSIARWLPVIQFIRPLDGALVRGIVGVEVEASSPAGILRVELVADGTAVGADYQAPYSFTWDARGITDGAHTLLATAYDTVGNVTGTAITVRNLSTSGSHEGRAAISASTYRLRGETASVSSTGVLYVD